MTVLFRIILIVASTCTSIFMIKKIRQSKVQIEDAIFWIVFSGILLVMSIFQQIPDFLAKVLGIYSTVNFVFLFFIFILLVKIFYMTIKMSQMENKIKELAQKIALKENDNNK